MQQYSPLIDEQKTQMGNGYTDAVAKQRENVNALEIAVKHLRRKPHAFNGPLGFAFFASLDDADRDAVLCANVAEARADSEMMSGDSTKAITLMHLAEHCSDLDALIYTVSENAESLYQRYVEAEYQLANEGVEVGRKCMDILKKSGLPAEK